VRILLGLDKKPLVQCHSRLLQMRDRGLRNYFALQFDEAVGDSGNECGLEDEGIDQFLKYHTTHSPCRRKMNANLRPMHTASSTAIATALGWRSALQHTRVPFACLPSFPPTSFTSASGKWTSLVSQTNHLLTPNSRRKSAREIHSASRTFFNPFP
jgi:hypothetical protein